MHLRHTVDLSPLFYQENPEPPDVEVPKKPIDEEVEENPAKHNIYQLKLKEYIREEKALKVTLKSMWAVIWGQCLNSICTKLKKDSRPSWCMGCG